MLGSVSDLLHWLLLAVGAALFTGTGAALLHYRRTGRFPNQPSSDRAGRPLQPSPRPAVAKCALGALLVVWGVAGLVS